MYVVWKRGELSMMDEARTACMTEPPYVWVPSINGSPLHVYTLMGGDTLTLGIWFEPHFHWVDVCIDTNDLDKSGIAARYTSHNGMLTIDYGAHKHYSSKFGGLLLHIELVRVEVQSTVECVLLQHQVAEAPRHCVVCMCHGAYLGRAQTILTWTPIELHEGERHYTWLPRTHNQARNWEADCQDALDLEFIHSHLPITTRTSAQRTPDHDNYSNERRVLPVVLQSNESLTLHFYNLSQKGRHAEETIRWATLASNERIGPHPLAAPQKRRSSIGLLMRRRSSTNTLPPCRFLDSIQVGASPHMLLSLWYTFAGTRVEILKVELTVQRYITTLCRMDDSSIPPKTI